ncbi:MAG: hybrid sensor histidine kinase/response regulator [Desulfobulbaceae bacterium]|jgi:two-component system chemotaxis sensor kinase CheA|nr:hybrid sensor histidine kinase/response regulator [Desulfobulbaceae bacterium]
MSTEQETIDDILLNDPEMVEAFVAEANEHLDSIEDDFLTLERQQGNPDKTLLDKVFRAIHSVKGAAGFLNLSRMAELAHIMEALLTKMRAGKILPASDNIDSLLAGVDLLKTMLRNIKESNGVDIRLVHEKLTALTEKTPESSPPPKETSPPPAGREPAAPPAPEKIETDLGNTVRIHVDILDKLMVQAGELVLIRNQQLLHVDESDSAARSIAHRLDRITSELQQTIISTRMQPVGKVIDKFPRIIRDMGKSLGKQIDIEIIGSSAELDKTILESLTDPLTHIIRNSCGHGIETPEERVKAGKPKTGLITIAAYHEAGRVNIRIDDDGRGVDIDRIRKKVVEKGLKTPAELEQMTHQEILNLVFLPGFSTMDQADDVCGRGVGMDVVKTGIEKIGGTFEFESRTGEGTTILLQLPLTLAIIPSLIVSALGHLFAIPQVSLVELVTLYDEDVRRRIERADDQEVYRLRGRLLPIVRLAEVLNRPQLFNRETRTAIAEKYARLPPPAAGGPESETDSLSFVVLKVGNSLYGLVVDAIIGTEEIVVKPLHPPIKALGIYSGATIMGSGKTALILDVGGIARHTGITLADRIMEQREKEFRTEDQQSVLLFKSGPKEQFALSLPLIRRIEPIIATDIELIGDREYITVDNTSTQVLRLDHFLEVSPIEDHDNLFLILPRHLKRPVGILMTAFVDVVETGMTLDVDSYRADGLLGTAILNNSMTLFIDIYRLVEKVDPEYRELRAAGDGLAGEDGSVRGPARILLLEDIAFFRQLIKGYLNEKGYEVVDCKNGKLGLEELENNDFDLIVSDLEMPVMNGWQFIDGVRRSPEKRGIPAVALTSLDTEEARHKTMESGFDYFEIKLDREHFLRTVATALQKHHDSSPS